MSLPRQIARGVRALLRRGDADRDVDDEVRHYLHEATGAYERAGLSHTDAVRAATLDVGNSTVVREQVRGSGWEHRLETMIADVRYALRRLRRSPAFTVTAVATLALGIGASTTVFSVISPILLEPLPFPHASRLVTADDRNVSGFPMPATLGTFAEVRARSHSFEALAAADDWHPSISGNGEPERLAGQRVTSDYFGVYGASPAVGRGFAADDERPGSARVVILSDGLLQRRFGGDRSIVGRTIELDGDPYTVVGIMPPAFTNVIAPAAELWGPLRDQVTADLSSRAWGHHYKIVGRLAPNATAASAMRELLAIGRAPIAGFARPSWANLASGLLVRSIQDDVSAPVKPSLFAMIGAVLLLLAIAAVNVTNLLLARGALRRPELAMRVALGASRGRILAQLLTESIVLALVGGVLGLLIARAGVRALLAASPPGLPRLEAIRIDAQVFIFALCLTTLVGVLVGLAPALGALRGGASDGRQPIGGRVTSRRASARSVLVVAEVALALVLMVSAGLLVRSVGRLMSVPPGFDPTHVVTMQVVAAGHTFDSDAARLQFYDQTLDAVRHAPGVAAAAYSSQLPLSGDVDGYGYEVQSIAGSLGGNGGSALRYAVTPDYFATMRIPLRAGRLVDVTDRAGGPESVVINESMAKRLFGTRNPIGERIRFGPEVGSTRPWDQIVGVVGDVKHYSLGAGAPDAFYVAPAQWDWVDNVQTLIVRTSGDAAALVPALRRAVWRVNGNQPIQRVRTMESFVAASAGQRRFALLVIETFAVAALGLAAIGLYGVIAGGVVERIREIGIRAALGAAPADIVRGVVRRALLLVITGAVIGAAASLGATRLIQSMLFGVSRLDVATYGAVIVLLLLTATLAAWAPARRAAGVDPTTALRAD